MIPGFVERLEEELIELMDQPEYQVLVPLKKYVRFIDPIFPRNILNWIGGSIVSTLPGIEKYAVLPEKYKEKGVNDTFGSYYLLGNRPVMSEIYRTNERRRVTLSNT